MKKNVNSKAKTVIVGGGWPFMLNMEPMLCKLLKDELKFKVIFIAKTKEDVKYFTQHYNDSFNKIIYNEKGIDVTNKKNLVNFEDIEK